MRMKLFLAILFAAFSSPLFAQSGGIKGVVVSRAERALIDDAKVTRRVRFTPRKVRSSFATWLRGLISCCLKRAISSLYSWGLLWIRR